MDIMANIAKFESPRNSFNCRSNLKVSPVPVMLNRGSHDAIDPNDVIAGDTGLHVTSISPGITIF
jgi:hypothetical protein